MENPANHSNVFGKQAVDIRHYLRVIWKRRLFVILPTVLVIGGSMFYVLRMINPVYQASATIVFTEKAQLLHSLEDYVVQEDNRKRLALITSQIHSRGFLDKVIMTLGLDQNPGLWGKAEKAKKKLPEISLEEIVNRMLIDYLRRTISVRGEEKAPNFFQVVAITADPEGAVRLADTVARIFVAEKQTAQLQRIRATSDFTVEQLSGYKKRLRESEARLEEYEKGISSRSTRSDAAESEMLSHVNSLLLNAKVDHQQQTEKLKGLKSKTPSQAEKAAIETSLPYDSRFVSSKEEFLKKETQLTELLLERPWKDPTVISRNQEIHKVRNDLRDRISRLIAQEYAQTTPAFRDTLIEIRFIEVELQAIEKAQNKLQEYLDNHRTSEQNSFQLAKEKLRLQRLREEVEHNRKVYNMFFEQSAAAQISEALEITKLGNKFEILESAQRPLKPTESRRQKILFLGCSLGVGLGLGLAFGVEFLDRSLKSVEDIESHLRLPVLGTIPRMPALWGRKGRGLKIGLSRSMLKIVAGMIILAAICAGVMVFVKSPYPPFLSEWLKKTIGGLLSH